MAVCRRPYVLLMWSRMYQQATVVKPPPLRVPLVNANLQSPEASHHQVIDCHLLLHPETLKGSMHQSFVTLHQTLLGHLQSTPLSAIN